MTTSYSLSGIFGGTFDPIHNGHVIPLKQAAREIGINSLGLMPCHIPPHRATPSVSSQQRMEMVQLVCNESPLFFADDCELKQDSPSYTVTTLSRKKQQSENTALCFFMGMDSLKSFDTWYRWQEILDLCHLVVCKRGQETEQFNSTIQQLLDSRQTQVPVELTQSESGLIYLADTDKIDISATQIRQRINKGETFEHLVPNAVAQFIHGNGLYRDGSDKLLMNP